MWILCEKEGIYILTIHSKHGGLEYAKEFGNNSESLGLGI